MEGKGTELLSKSLNELRIGVKLRRKLLNLGFCRFGDIVNSDINSLEDELEWDDFDSLAELIESFESDPDALCRRLTSLPNEDEAIKIKRTIAASRYQAIGFPRASSNNKKFLISHTNVRLPEEIFVVSLRKTEFAAEKAILSLADHPEDAILAECFPKLILKLDSLRSDVLALFEHYKDKGTATDVMCQYFPNCFLLFVAHYASEDFDGNVLWDKMFEFLNIERQSVRTLLKKAFYQGLTDRGLPVFSKDESTMYFRSTAILHGGFSKSIWMPLWKNALLPFAKRHRGTFPFNAHRQVASSLKSEFGTYQLKRAYAEDVIEKTPSTMLESLIESALKVANDVVLAEGNCDDDSNGFEILANHGLPDAAMLALQEVLETEHEKRRHYLYLPSAELTLDPAAGMVHLHWDAQIFPSSFAGKSIAYCINGSIEHTEELMMSVGKCILQERDIPIRPNTRFDVELFLLDSDGKRTASTRQTFSRTRPGSFEFVSSGDGLFKLRKQHWKVRRKNTLAYLTKPDFTVVPGLNMVQIEAYEANREWSGASIQLFEVEPGSSGSILNTRTGDIVASWQEGFRTEIDRSHVIGKAEGGYDLYGFTNDTKFGGNAALPEIYVEVPYTIGIRDELKIYCTCDGKPVSVHRSIERDYDGFIPLDTGRLILSFPRTIRVPPFAKECHIRIDQAKAHTTILDYKFAVIPIMDFGIESLFLEGDSVMATYGFNTRVSLTVSDEYGTFEMMPKERYQFNTALADTRKELGLTLGEDGSQINVALSLAAIDIAVSKSLQAIRSARMLRIFDLGMVDGRINISSSEHRRTRGCAVFVGPRPVLYREKMPGTELHSFDVLGHSEYFNFERIEEIKPVQVLVAFGTRSEKGASAAASADINIAMLATGFGLGEISTCVCNGIFGLRFENAAPCNLDIELTDRRGKPLGKTVMPKSEIFAPLPRKARCALDIKKIVIARIMEVSLFGIPNEDTAITVELRK